MPCTRKAAFKQDSSNAVFAEIYTKHVCFNRTYYYSKLRNEQPAQTQSAGFSVRELLEISEKRISNKTYSVFHNLKNLVFGAKKAYLGGYEMASNCFGGGNRWMNKSG